MFIFNKKNGNRKAQSTGFAWVLGLVLIFGLGVMYVIFNQTFTAYLVPTAKNLVNVTTIPSATQALINADIDKYMAFWNALPYIMFFVIIIFMIIAGIRREGETEY